MLIYILLSYVMLLHVDLRKFVTGRLRLVLGICEIVYSSMYLLERGGGGRGRGFMIARASSNYSPRPRAGVRYLMWSQKQMQI